jgi:homoserine O-acetyltransferase
MKYAINAYGIATGGGTLAYQMLAPTAAKADKIVDERLAVPVTADANDFIYQWEASHDYNPAPGWSGSRPRCSRSTPPMTNAIRRKPA